MKTHNHLTNPSLWQQLCAFRLNDDPTATVQFSDKLIKEQKWTLAFAQRALAEYKKFLYLCVTQPQGASPSPVVDEVWHLHLTFTENYWQKLCGEVLHKQLHHYPNKGGTSENLRHQNWYNDTLTAYVREFGELPPADIWTIPKTLNLDEHLPAASPFKKPSFDFSKLPNISQTWNIGAALLLVVSLIGFGFSGSQYLVLYALLVGWTWWGTALKMKAKKEILHQATRQLHPLQFAAIFRDTETVFKTLIADLAERGLIAYTASEQFWYDKKTSMPIFHNLQAQEAEYLDTKQLRHLLYPHAQAVAKVTGYLRNAFEQHTTFLSAFNWWVLVIGIARIFQGLFNDRPVLFLVFEIIVFILFWVIISNSTSLKDSSLRTSYQNSGWGQQVAFGALGLMILGGDYRLAQGASIHQLFGPARQSDGGGSDGSVSSGCGSSGGDGGGDGGGCGGGCGGCGGS
ncbi:MAG: hypothetical protein MUE30_17110 [Spirosomaceae bacterium]|nr:hypothetical protein [Spirosomataceae bacterium]